MSNATVLTGNFISTGANVLIPLRSGVTWMNVYNVTAMNAETAGNALQFYWQIDMTQGFGISYIYVGSPISGYTATYQTNCFQLIDTSAANYGTIHTTITAISTASIPVATNSSTNGLVAGQVVRLFNVVGAPQLSGLDFTVGYNTLSTTTFSLDYMAQLSVAGTTGSWTVLNFDPIFYPRRRYITKISKASQAVVTLSVTHGYQVGQVVRMVVPAAFGMPQMNGLQATIVAVNTTTTSGNTITLNVDSTSFTTFAFPLAAAVPFSPAEVVPMGEDTAAAETLNVPILSDSVINTAQVGLLLYGTEDGPAGAANDQIFWQAGIGFSNNGL